MSSFKTFRIFLKTAWQVSPSYVISLLIEAIFGSVLIIGNVIIPKYLIDSLMQETRNLDIIILWVAVMVAFNLVMGVFTKSITCILKIKNDEIIDLFYRKLSEKIMAIEYHYLEDPYYLDLKERAAFACTNQSALYNLINSFSSMIKNIITIISLIIIILTLHYLLLIFLVVTIALALIINAMFKKYQVQFYQSLIPINRKYGYYIDLCYKDKLAKDIRLYQLNDLISPTIEKFQRQITNSFKKFFTRMGFSEGVIGIINVLQNAGIYLFIAYRVFSEKLGPKISLGQFTMYVSAATSFSTAVKSFFNNFFVINQMLSYLKPFMEFMDLPEEKLLPSEHILEDTIKSIRFDHVTFKYPKSDKVILDDISFSIKQGEKISIVGLNGAGKTTLVKLICRLYHPTSGKIYINDIDIFDYEYTSYIKNISAIFQDYKIFDYTIEENIVGCYDLDDKKINGIIEQVGLSDKIKSLPHGLNTILGKKYVEEGIELSGGQNQKVAIARSLYKDSSLIILDEPTSALDPLAEADIYQNFNNLVQDKTALYISHRMSSSVFCDRILIIDAGRIADFDTHHNLMKKTDSLYYKLFTSQAHNYEYKR